MKVNRRWTNSGKKRDPLESVVFTSRDVPVADAQRGKGGEKGLGRKFWAPESWSQMAVEILATKYARLEGVPREKIESYLPEDGELSRLEREDLLESGREFHARMIFDRLAKCWREWGEKAGYFDSPDSAQSFEDECLFMLAKQMGSPNSPQWFNTGIYSRYGLKGKPQGHYFVDPKTKKVVQSNSAYERPQPHACFIQSVKDDLISSGGIMELWLKEARLFKYGSGSGTNFSHIRGRGEPLSGGGKSSGLMSFLKVGDVAAGAVRSGGKTRRAAKMVCLDADHPDIEEFVGWKSKEERKVAALVSGSERVRRFLQSFKEAKDNKRRSEVCEQAKSEGIPEGLIKRAYSLFQQGRDVFEMEEYTVDWDDEAYATVSGQNANISVRLSHNFFIQLRKDDEWKLWNRTDGSLAKTLSAKKLWEDIATEAWECADPGIQFDGTINEWHTCPGEGPIRASNPCSEYMFLDDTACNLASLNVLKFIDDEGEFLLQDFQHAVRIWTLVLEISVVMAQFPGPEIAENTFRYRTLGLGFSNLGALLMVKGLPYDSAEGRALASSITALMSACAYKTSCEMAREHGPFAGFERNRFDVLRVLHNHAMSLKRTEEFQGLTVGPMNLDFDKAPRSMVDAAEKVWDEVLLEAEKVGVRNAQISAIAPTGTIGLVMDCDTTGIEPDYALVKNKRLAGGGSYEIINHSVPTALKRLGYGQKEIEEIVAYALGTEDKKGAYTLESAPHLKREHLPIFDCAHPCGEKGTRAISAEGHLKMMGAVQPFVSGSISKTVNLPATATVDDVKSTFEFAYELMLKSVAVYRDGSKLSQPMQQAFSLYEDEICPFCQSLTLVRTGSCFRCDTCGESTSCS